MTTKPENQDAPENAHRLLGAEEQAIFGQIATTEPPHSARAQALLAIDEGATQVEAGRQAGLTREQVRYWLNKFRRDGISIFPEELLNQAQQAPGEEGAQQDLPDAEETAGPVDEAAELQEDAPKAKKKSAKKKSAKKMAKKKSKKKSEKAGKSGKRKKSKRAKKAKKGKKSAKKKKGSKKAKGKSSKKSKKKNKE
jgi:hypothetical protein